MNKMRERIKAAEYEYGAYAPCGCLVGLCIDLGDRETAKSVAEWIKDGCHIERFHRSELDKRLESGFGCKCEEKKANREQPSLFEATP